MKRTFYSVYEDKTIEFTNSQVQNDDTTITSIIEDDYAEIIEEKRLSLGNQHIVSVIIKKYHLDGSAAYITEEINGFSKEIPSYLSGGSSHYTYHEDGKKVLTKRITTETNINNSVPFKNKTIKNTLIFDRTGTKISEVSIEETTEDIKGSKTITHNYNFRQPVSFTNLLPAIKNSENLVDVYLEEQAI